MISNALRATQLANWGAEHRIPAAHLDQIRGTLDRGERKLDLSVIAVREIPGFLRAEQALDSLSLRFAGEEQIHIDTAGLPRLRKLRIVNSDMEGLLITGKDELQVCSGAHCVLEVCDSKNLRDIEMHSGAFDTLRIGDMPRLRMLDLADSRLRRVAVFRAPRLQRLDLSMNPLCDRGLELNEVDELATILLGLGSLRCVPEGLGQLPALRELDLRGNRISVITPGDLPASLVSLDLSGNCLTAAPLEGAYQAGLRDLRLGMNRIEEVPGAIGAFKRLETLDLSHNRIKDLPPEMGRCDLLRVLKLSSNDLFWLPPEVCQLTSLETLHLDHNALLALPVNMYCLIRLTCLQLRRNALTNLPARLEELPIRRLILSGNPLSSVPEVLLRQFTLAGGPAFRALAALDLGETRLARLPAGLGFRSTLVQLRLRKNPQLRDLPYDFINLRCLRWLELTGCGFTQLPLVLARMSRHTDVFMHLNSLVQRTRGHEREPGNGARVLTREPRMAGSVTEEVRAWRALVGQDLTCKEEACWNANLPPGHSGAFAYLIAALRSLPEFKRSSVTGHTRFWFAVNRLFLDIEAHPDLSDYIFDEAEMNTVMLADRHRLSFERLALAARLHALAKDGATQGLAAVMLMQESFRCEQVAAIAAQRGEGRRADAPFDLELAYRIRLSREPDGFSFDYDAALDSVCPRLRDTHIRTVLANIRRAEERQLVDYMCNSPIWRRYLTRARAGAYLALIEGFDARVDATHAEDAWDDGWRANNRHMLLIERDEAVRAWLRDQTIALLADNPLPMEPGGGSVSELGSHGVVSALVEAVPDHREPHQRDHTDTEESDDPLDWNIPFEQ